jgi:hypothetical protein
MFALMTEFRDMYNPVLDKEDCELNAFRRLAERLRTEFPKLPICLLMDGLYPLQSVFDLIESYGWKFIATLREGRQPTGWDEAVQTTLLSPSHVVQCRRKGEDGLVEQTLRWTQQVPFGDHAFQVLFSGEISPTAATLWSTACPLELEPLVAAPAAVAPAACSPAGFHLQVGPIYPPCGGRIVEETRRIG